MYHFVAHRWHRRRGVVAAVGDDGSLYDLPGYYVGIGFDWLIVLIIFSLFTGVDGAIAPRGIVVFGDVECVWPT